MKILLYDYDNWIANQFIVYFSANKISYVKSNCSFDDIDNIKNEIIEHNPTHILSLIGKSYGNFDETNYNSIDYLEQKSKLVENIKYNLYMPIILANICKELHIHLTYFGSGCIFKNTDQQHNFTEEDKPNFFGSSYSVVKGFTDLLMHQYNNVLNLRTRLLVNSENNFRNLITKLTLYEKICSMTNSITVLPELIPVAIDMMKKNISGTFNFTNPGTITHNDILLLYKEYIDINFTWKNYTIEEQNKLLLAERTNNSLNTRKLIELYPNVTPIKDAIINCLKLYPKKVIFTNSLDINLLVTGGCGFIGSHFINHMFDKYDKINIINIDAMYYCANENNIRKDIRNSKRYVFIKGNICTQELITYVLTTYNINYVVHFAAQSHVQNSFNDSILYTHANTLGTHTLLECCRIHNKIKRFIHVSTDEVYGESMLDDIEKHKTELSILCPTNPYAGTKAAAELIAQTYYHSFKMPIIITRGNNVFGPNQYPEKVIPLFIKLLKENKKVTIQGTGNQLRAFLYISDVVKAFDIILNNGYIGQIYNIGCNEHMEYSIMDIAKILIKLLKNTEDYDKWIEYIEDRPFNDVRYYISNKKLKDLGWKIEVKFEDGIRELL